MGWYQRRVHGGSTEQRSVCIGHSKPYFIKMKIAILIFAFGLSVVASKPNESSRGEKFTLPCGGDLADIVNCTCDSGDIVTPGGKSCHALGAEVTSCICKSNTRK